MFERISFRVNLFLERIAESPIDECTTDGYNNPIGIMRGTSQSMPPILVVAHMDTAFGKDVDHHFTVGRNSISGAGLLDNSLGVGILASLPQILHRLGLKFQSDIILAGVIQSIGRGNHPHIAGNRFNNNTGDLFSAFFHHRFKSFNVIER